MAKTNVNSAITGVTAGINKINEENNKATTAGTVTSAISPLTQGINLITSSGTGDTYGTGGSGAGTTVAASNDYMNQAIAAYQEALAAQERQRQAAYNTALSQAKTAYELGRDNLQTNSDEAKRQAYINFMLNKRDLNNQLQSAGINGGASESILANMYNAYGNSRNNIDKETSSALQDLLSQYNTNVANLGSNYGSDYTDLLSNYYNNIANLKANYASDLASSLGKTSSTSSSSASTTADTKAAETNRSRLITALKAAGNDADSLKQILSLYGYDYDTVDGKQALSEAGYNPYNLGTKSSALIDEGNGSGNATEDVLVNPNTNQLLNNIRSAYNSGQGADYVAKLINSGLYSKEYIQALLDKLGY